MNASLFWFRTFLRFQPPFEQAPAADSIHAAIALRLAAGSAAKGLQGGSCSQYNQQRRVDTPLHTQEVKRVAPSAVAMSHNARPTQNDPPDRVVAASPTPRQRLCSGNVQEIQSSAICRQALVALPPTLPLCRVEWGGGALAPVRKRLKVDATSPRTTPVH